MKNIKTFQIMVILACIVFLVLFLIKGNGIIKLPSFTPETASIESSKDLNTASSDLDKTNLESIDNSLNTLDSNSY